MGSIQYIMSQLQLGIFLNLGNAQAKQHTNTLPSQSSIPDSWNNCHWIRIPKSPVPSPKRISFSAKVCIWYGFKYPLSSHSYEKVVIEMLWKISSFPTNLICLFAPCMTIVSFAAPSILQSAPGLQNAPGPPGTAPLPLISRCTFFLPLLGPHLSCRKDSNFLSPDK